MAATPWVLLDALAEHALQHSNIELYQLHLEHAEGLAKAVDGGHLAPKAYFASEYNRQLIQAGKADYIPISLSDIPRLFRKGEHHRTGMASVHWAFPWKPPALPVKWPTL